MRRSFQISLYIMPFIFYFLLIYTHAASAAVPQTQNNNEILMIAPTFNIQGAGISIDGIQKIGDNLIGILKKRTGIQITYEMVGSPEMDQEQALDLALERMKTAGDMSWTDYTHYTKALKMGIPLGVISMMQIGDSTIYRNCLYTIKDSPYKEIEDFRGKRINGGPILDWVGLRSLLYNYKIDETPDKYFGDLVPMSSFFASLNGVLMKRIDVFVMLEPLFNVLKKTNPNYQKIVPIVCAEGAPNALLPVYRKGVDPIILATMRSILNNANNDPDMGVIRPFLESADIKFVDPNDEALKQMERLYKQAEDRGWYKEAKKYLVDFEEVALKKSLKKCKENCSGATPDTIKACMAKCDEKIKSKH